MVITRRNALRMSGLLVVSATVPGVAGCDGTATPDVAGRKPLWRQKFAFSGGTDGDSYGARRVAVSGDTVFAANAGNLYAFAAAGGKPRWRSPYGPYDDTTITKEAPVVGGDTVMTVRIQQGSAATLYGIDAATGARRWQFAGSHAVARAAGSLTVLDLPPAVTGDVAYFATGDLLYALDAATGQVRWKRDSTGRPFHRPVVCAGLVVVDDDKFIAAFDTSSGRVRWVRHSLTGTLLADDRALYCVSDVLSTIDPTTGRTRWSSPKPDRGEIPPPASTAEALRDGGQPLLAGENIYLTSDVSGVASMWALRTTDGKVRWTFKAAHRLGGPATATADTFYCDAPNGYLYALDAHTGRLRWTLTTKGSPISAPTAYGNTVYTIAQPSEHASDLDTHLYALPA